MGARKFSLYDIEPFIKEAGAERVTEDAVLELEIEIEKLAEKLANRAMRYAEHAGRRKLIRTEDVILTKKVAFMDYKSPENFNPKASITKSTSRSER